MTSHLVAVHAYIGVLDVCLSAAAKRDPQGLALHFYKNGEPNEDQQGLQAYVARTSAYKYITNMIRQLMNSNEAAEHVETIFEVRVLIYEALTLRHFVYLHSKCY